MAEATDRNTTSSRISWDEAVTRAGSSEKLLSFLREVPVLAWHQGLFYHPSGRRRQGPGEFDLDPSWAWWAEARVDPATGRVIFLMEDIVSSMIASASGFVGDHAQPADSPKPKDEVFAFDIELERGVIEAQFSAQPKPPEPERVETPAKPVERKEPSAWQAWARDEYPKEQNERTIPYIRRLHGKMTTADNVTEVWEFANFRRRYFEAVKADHQAVQKQRKSPHTV